MLCVALIVICAISLWKDWLFHKREMKQLEIDKTFWGDVDQRFDKFFDHPSTTKEQEKP